MCARRAAAARRRTPTAREVGPWETFTSTVPLFKPAKGDYVGLQGQLRLESGAVRDDTGFVLPLFVHAGDIMAEWLHNPGFVDQFLALCIQYRYTGIRFWSSLAWHDHPDLGTVLLGPPFQSNYYDLLAEFLTKIRDLGLQAHIAAGTLYPQDVGDQDDFARRQGQVVQSVGPHVCAMFEGANESRDTCPGWDSGRLAQYVNAFARECPAPLRGLSAFTGHEDAIITNDYARDPATVAIYHQMRLARLEDMMQHTFSYRYIGTEYPDQDPPSVMVDRSHHLERRGLRPRPPGLSRHEPGLDDRRDDGGLRGDGVDDAPAVQLLQRPRRARGERTDRAAAGVQDLRGHARPAAQGHHDVEDLPRRGDLEARAHLRAARRHAGRARAGAGRPVRGVGVRRRAARRPGARDGDERDAVRRQGHPVSGPCVMHRGCLVGCLWAALGGVGEAQVSLYGFQQFSFATSLDATGQGVPGRSGEAATPTDVRPSDDVRFGWR